MEKTLLSLLIALLLFASTSVFAVTLTLDRRGGDGALALERYDATELYIGDDGNVDIKCAGDGGLKSPHLEEEVGLLPKQLDSDYTLEMIDYAEAEIKKGHKTGTYTKNFINFGECYFRSVSWKGRNVTHSKIIVDISKAEKQ